jgi:hypothetical protein
MNENVKRLTKVSALVLAACVAAACEATKSETPTSPNVAGPIAGVGITVPGPMAPINGAAVVNSEPLRLTWGQSTTNGVRALWYSVEIAVDRDFAQRAYFNPKVLPVDGPQMSLVVDAKLDAERTYFWRVRAEDGANSSDYSHVAHFDLVVPVVLGRPTAVSPSGGQTVTSTAPQLVVNNGSVEGRAGDVSYVFQVSTNQAFSSLVWEGEASRSSGASTSRIAGNLVANTLYYWRAYATNGVVNSGPSATLSFRTPASSGGGGGGGGGLPPAPGGGFRTPDPAPGQRLGLPGYGAAVVQQVAAQFPGALRNSCQEHGGSWEFMDRVVDALRQHDTRWGYNWKRGNVGDPSQDAVDYHWGRGQSENSTEVYIIDVIGSHCGDPNPAWIDQTQATRDSGTIGRWTGRGRFSN